MYSIIINNPPTVNSNNNSPQQQPPPTSLDHHHSIINAHRSHSSFITMDLLKLELQKKRKAIDLAKKSADVGRIENGTSKDKTGSSRRSYFKTADMRRFQERQEEKDAKSKRKASSKASSTLENKKKHKVSNTERTTSKSNELNEERITPTNHEKIKDKERERITMSSEAITNSLRELGMPVRLFGEIEDIQRLDRLKEAKEDRKAAMAGLSEMDEYRLGSGHGIRNPFIGKNKDEDLELIQTNAKKSKEKMNPLDTDDNSDDPHKNIHSFFKNLLRQWEEDLADRPDSVKRTAAGKNETKTLKQCKDYIRPLFKLCKNRTLEENIMKSIVKIVHFCKEGEFVKANDVYMDVAIGRAAWPIGVTNVGIHQRSGRERINADKVAHVMNSELQRKYLTSVKRLITFSQKKRPDVDPSKKVTNV